MTTCTGLLFALVTAAAPAPRGMVLDFSAKWCGPCQQVAPLVARLERDGHPIHSIDVDARRDLAKRFNVTAMPTFVLLVDGKEVDRNVGMMSESQLRAWLDRIPRETARDTILVQSENAAEATAFVADPNVRLGDPGPFDLAEAGRRAEQDLEERPAPQRAQSPDALSSAQLASESTHRDDGVDIRASDAPLVESAEPLGAVSPPMASSVRLRVTIDGRINLGSGTIVASNENSALIVTCGHIFRGFAEDSQIEINLFERGVEKSLAGKLVKFDLEADVGLVKVQTTAVLPAVAVADELQRVQAEEQVLSIGCSGGQPPTAQELQVTAVNPYLGPDNLECTGVPVQGRSGGGLFKSSGELVGVCIAADPERKRGVYAGLLAIHELLADAGYASLYRQPEPPVVAVETPEVQRKRQADEAPAAAALGASLLESLTPADDWSGAPRGGEVQNAGVSLASDVASRDGAGAEALVAMGKHARDAEIVCIIRPRDGGDSPSEVVIVHQASPKLLAYLRGEIGTNAGSLANPAILSEDASRRSRDSSVPTMDVSPSHAFPPTGGEFRTESRRMSERPSLHPTALVEPILPRRYIRTR